MWWLINMGGLTRILSTYSRLWNSQDETLPLKKRKSTGGSYRHEYDSWKDDLLPSLRPSPSSTIKFHRIQNRELAIDGWWAVTWNLESVISCPNKTLSSKKGNTSTNLSRDPPKHEDGKTEGTIQLTSLWLTLQTDRDWFWVYGRALRIQEPVILHEPQIKG